ncbi:MAG: hypothetical protein ACI8Y4_005297 [Candidatus Poriferisodalaceae bacterium]|jgi:uncharacterized protein (TIGR00369 family)
MAKPTPVEVNDFVIAVFPSIVKDGYSCDAIGVRSAVCRWTLDETRLRPGGLISGPTQFSAADMALWFLAFTELGLAPMAVTSNMTIDFLKPASGGDLLATATMLRAGRSRITGRVDIRVEGNDQIVGHATGSYSVLRTPSSNDCAS